MRSSSSSQSIPFKSKKPLHFQPESADPNPLPAKTPEKPPSRRPRNSSVALSINEIRKAARTRPQNHSTHQIESPKKQILQRPARQTSSNNNLPPKLMLLVEFFNSLDSVIRLLSLKRSMPTFTNLAPRIQSLTDRRFSYGHLAQLKFLLPEAIEIRKVVAFDEKTSCMKPDLHVSLNVDAVECDPNAKSDSKNLNLRKVFHARLLDFHKDHPEGDDVPEGMLPEPFNCFKPNSHMNMTKNPTISTLCESPSGRLHKQQQVSSASCGETLAVNTLASSINNQKPAAASHLSHSFQRHFSKKLAHCKAEKTGAGHKLSKDLIEPSATAEQKPCVNKFSSGEEVVDNESTSIQICAASDCETSSCPAATPIKMIDSKKTKDDAFTKDENMESTPAKIASTPARLMAATPASHPQKRCYMTPENPSSSSSDKLIRRRSLRFDTPVKSKKAEAEFNLIESRLADDDILNILPDSLLQSIREKERKATEERDPAISQAKRRRQMIGCLPKLFNSIHFFFQSISRSVITKEELIHKMISSQHDITDRREVEEQLTLLLELVPEWITEKSSSSGDLLVRINKASNPESIRAQLEVAR